MLLCIRSRYDTNLTTCCVQTRVRPASKRSLEQAMWENEAHALGKKIWHVTSNLLPHNYEVYVTLCCAYESSLPSYYAATITAIECYLRIHWLIRGAKLIFMMNGAGVTTSEMAVLGSNPSFRTGVAISLKYVIGAVVLIWLIYVKILWLSWIILRIGHSPERNYRF